MIENREENKFFLEGLIESLHDISSAEYQESVWVRHERNLIDSFEDSVTTFLDRCEIILENYKSYGLDEEKFNLLKMIYDKIDNYFFSEDSEKKDADILKDPHWKEITNLARGAYHKLTRHRILNDGPNLEQDSNC